MPNVKTHVSITFLGTCHHRDTHRHALVSAHDQINQLAQEPGSSVAAWLIDGPGCRGSLEHPMPGTYYYRNGVKISDPDLAAGEERKFRDALRQSYHALTGEGIESSILEATNYLDEIIGQNGGEIPTELSLQGFSRGADNCVRLANVLYLLYPEIKINLFLIDPVPGPGRRDDSESYHIPPSVNNCHVSLMIDEHRPFFEPQHSGRYVFSNPETKVAYHYMPGRHGAGLTTRENTVITPAVSQVLVQDSLLKFNIETGMLPKDAKIHNWHRSVGGQSVPQPLETPQKSFTNKERFAQLCIAMQAHKSLSQRMIVNFYHKRRIFTHRHRYVLDADLFIDPEHRDLFKTEFPATFNWFFEKNFTPASRKKRYARQDVFAELQQLSRPPYAEFYQNLLAKYKIKEVNTKEDIIAPQGIARKERLSYNEPLVSDELSYLQYCLRTIVSEYQYRAPTTWFGNWLPGHDDVITKSSQSDRIKKEINEALYQSERLPSEQAKQRLKELIFKIKSSPNQEFFFNQVKKIIPNSRRYLKSVLATLERYEAVLPQNYAALIAKSIYLIQKQIDHPLKDDYQKRIQVQAYLLSLNTAMRGLNTQPSDKNILCEQLFKNLNQLSSPSYAEPRLLDNIISGLESYKRRHTFFSYFPCSQAFGFYKPENMTLVIELLGELNQIKYSSAEQADLTQIESVLKHASLKYAKIHKQEESETKFAFWTKHVTFKVDPLNQLIEKHLKKVTQLSNLIFSIPSTPDISPDHDTNLRSR